MYILNFRLLYIPKITKSFISSSRDEQRVEREELTRSLIGAQDSAVVQILLEICGRFKNITVHRLCCAHIHQMFIADPVLSKLVHFQVLVDLYYS